MYNTNLGLIYWENDARDWSISWLDLSLLGRLKNLHNEDNIAYLRSQNQYKWWSSCTKFAPLNSSWINYNIQRPTTLINEFEEYSKTQWRQWPWFGRSRWEWVKAFVKWYNWLRPDDQHISYMLWSFDSIEWEKIKELWISVICSIRVGIDFVKETIGGEIKNYYSSKTYAHATTIKKEWSVLIFWDSAFGNKRTPARHWRYTIDEVMFDRYIEWWNIANNFHILLPKNIIKMITKDVPAWQRFSEWIEKMIETWMMTKNEAWNFRPFDTLTRAELATVVDRLLKHINK